MEILAVVLGFSLFGAALALGARRWCLCGPAVPRREGRFSIVCQLLAGAGGLLAVNGLAAASGFFLGMPPRDAALLLVAPSNMPSFVAAFAACAVWLFSESWYGRSRRSDAALALSIAATLAIVLLAVLNARGFDSWGPITGLVGYQAVIVLAAVVGYRLSHGERVSAAASVG